MPLIRVSYAGHYDQSVKDAIMRDVTDAYVAATKSDAAKVWVVLEEVERSDWSTGGTALSAIPPAR